MRNPSQDELQLIKKMTEQVHLAEAKLDVAKSASKLKITELALECGVAANSLLDVTAGKWIKLIGKKDDGSPLTEPLVED